MSLVRAVALLGIGLLGTGCVNTADGIPTRAGRLGGTVLPVEQILPDAEEVSTAVGNDLPPHSPPLVGGIGLLPNGIRDNGGAAPIECLGAVAPAMRIVYEKAPVRGAATQDYWNYDSRVVVSSATAAAIKLASTADAQRLFASFVK
ncbi:MAG: sensor domain-containing protein, partial [Mycobacterium sp.]